MFFWLLAAVIFFIRQRKIRFRLLLGLTLIGLGFCITDSRLIYERIVLQIPLNRDFLTIVPVSFINSFTIYFFLGYYPAATLQFFIVDCVVLGVAYLIITKKYLYEYDTVLKICLSVCCFCALTVSLSEANILDKIILVILPFLKGIDLSRIYTVARMSWYIAFTASLIYLSKNKKHVDTAYVLAFFQIIFIFLNFDATYNDSATSWQHNLIGGPDITWREFYSEKQFKEIKDNINYNGENVCAVGYHPGVLLYNDFNTIDGYLSVYPYEQQLLWHDLEKTEFERNPVHQIYFDSWGGRRYIYNKDLSYEPTRNEKYHDGVNLYVDMNILKNDYHCKYILSRAELINAQTLGLKHLATFDNPESIYIIWVYEVI